MSGRGRGSRFALLSAKFANVDAWSDAIASPGARPLRFLAVGAVTFLLNVALLVAFTSLGLGAIPAYAVALALAVQFNFVVSQLLVWHDRPLALTVRHVAARWVSFHAWNALSLVVNMVAFAMAQLLVPDVAAAVVAVIASTGFKFLSLDRYAFRSASAASCLLRSSRKRTDC